MAINIVSNLTATPRRTRVPGAVTLRQTVISNQNNELIIAEFRLQGGHDIWFELPSGTPSKSITFQHEIGTENTDVSFSISLIRHVGTALDGTVGIDQTSTDSDGIQTPDHCVIVLLET